ncbi:MAG: T9SS type A sorting domain-containing protein [Bacteroidia bacterium]
MNNKIRLTLIASAILGAGTAFLFEKPLDPKDKFGRYLNEHAFNNRPHFQFDADEETENKTDRPDLAWEQDFLRTMNPSIGRPTPEVLLPVVQQMKNSSYKTNPGTAAAPWVERGPNNVGGRTRAIVFDPNDATGKKVWAGGVSGGLWYNNDITSSTSGWIAVNDFWADIVISCMSFDPNNSSVAYVGTGEGFSAGSSSGSIGAGIWKTVNGGISWTQLSSTTGYFYTNDIAVRNESGTSVIYAAVDERKYQGVYHGTVFGLMRSTDGGTTWTQVLPNISSGNYQAADIEIAANNRIWIGTKSNAYGYGGGAILYSDSGKAGSWTVSNTTTVSFGYGRVELACAPSNANYVYAMIEDAGAISTMKKTTNGTSSSNTWSTISIPVDADNGIPSTDFTRGQAWYDLIMAVDPNNVSNVLVGGVDLFSSNDGGSTWNQIGQWFQMGNNYSVVHADQHAIVFKPGSSSSVVFGNDGGIYYTSSLSSAANSNVIGSRNTNYNVTQFYACAIHPTFGVNNYLAGAQDNGTQSFTSAGVNTTTNVRGGDGAYCFIDQLSPNYQIASYVYNSYDLSTSGGGGGSFNTTLVADQTTGKFINPAGYDNNLHILYSCNSTSAIWRISNITTSPSSPVLVTITGMSNYASHIKVSPYTTSSSTLFIGSEGGKLFKVTNANTSSPTITNISGTAFPTGSISCVEIGASENELIVTFFNYGIVSVWYTSDGGTTWSNKEGNLPDMPIRWSLFNPNNRNEVILATELGVWGTTNFNAASPTWASSSNGLANVRVDMLQLRNSDKQVIAATHGRGLFSCNAFSSIQNVFAAFSASQKTPCLNETVTLKDTSLNLPTSWSWTITPSTFTFVGGTTASSQNPKVQFTANGNYSISLKVSNAGGTDSTYKSNYIFAGGFSLPFTENWENPATYGNWLVDNPDSSYTWQLYSTSGNGTSLVSAGIDNYDYTSAHSYPQADGMISPPIRLTTGYSSVTLNFKHAYRRYSPGYQDSLAIYVSTNCGTTWTRLALLKETRSSSPFVFITNSDYSSGAFVPTTATDWCGNANYAKCDSINLTSYIGNTIKIKFENNSGDGNNLFIDDIVVSGVSSYPPPVANFGASATSTCSTNPVTFTDSTTNSPYQWSWSFIPSTITYLSGTNSTSQNPVVLFNSGGVYSVSLTATNTNSGNTKTRTNYITVSQTVTPTISIVSGDTNICQGTTANFGSSISNGGSIPVFQWSVNGVNAGTNISTFTSSTLNNGDTVMCVLTSSISCATASIISSNKMGIKVSPTPAVPTVSQLGNVLTCSLSGLIYQWYINNTLISGATNQSYTIPQSGSYKVIITNTYGCSNISVAFAAIKVGVKELSSMNGFRIFPNPSPDFFNMQFGLKTSEKIYFTVFDLSGKKMFEEEKEFLQGTNSYSFNLWWVPKGTYLLQLNDGQSVMVRQIVVE